MNPAGPEDSNLLKEVIEYVLYTVSSEDLQFLLTEAQAWATFVAEARLSREEADALRAKLNELTTRKAPDDNNMHQKELECREMFLKVFPQLKVQLEELIAQLNQLADKADKVHKDCTIANVVADSTGVVSGAMTILGLFLVPFTAGGSMLLTGAGLGLGALSAGTSVTSNIVENENMSSLEAEANKLEARGFNIQKLIKEVLEALRESSSEVGLAKTSIGVVYRVVKHVRAIRVLHGNLSAAAQVSVRSSRLADSVLGPTGKLMGKGARAVGGLFTAGFLVLDAVNLVHESKDLQQGAKSELGKELRQKAQELEKVLQEINHIYQNLQ